MPNYYCKYCGIKNTSVQALVGNPCVKSPSRKHELYEGSEKSVYVCKYCGLKNSSFQALVGNTCVKSPSKKHEVAL
jgi:DNA-directed RNA polymerase subunit RPC12/RpoP